MHALFVHGMGRSPLSGWPMLRALRRAGMTTSTFGYAVTFEHFERIRARLVKRISALAARGEYIVIGHSLGGVLLLAALGALAAGTALPERIFLLGVPLRPARLARLLGRNAVYRALTRDCGQLLGSVERMEALDRTDVPTTIIAGVRGVTGRYSPFADEPNDGIVALSETSADWIADQIRVPVVHTLLPSSRRVADIIMRRSAGRELPTP